MRNKHALSQGKHSSDKTSIKRVKYCRHWDHLVRRVDDRAPGFSYKWMCFDSPFFVLRRQILGRGKKRSLIYNKVFFKVKLAFLPDLAALLTDMIPFVYFKLLLTVMKHEKSKSISTFSTFFSRRFNLIQLDHRRQLSILPFVYNRWQTTFQGQQNVTWRSRTVRRWSNSTSIETAINHLREIIWYYETARVRSNRKQNWNLSKASFFSVGFNVFFSSFLWLSRWSMQGFVMCAGGRKLGVNSFEKYIFMALILSL